MLPSHPGLTPRGQSVSQLTSEAKEARGESPMQTHPTAGVGVGGKAHNHPPGAADGAEKLLVVEQPIRFAATET